MPRRGLPFKACKNCHYLVGFDVEVCPNCGSKDFSEYWRGLVIILDVSSNTAKVLQKSKPGRYAIEVH
ncbi:MAG: DNA-binding protein [Candidatus Methanomethylicota archaeon]|uniref:Transcription elongation factor Spt4 n=1 Tax=Thermoproteota archaeon TaxID=2056631 RepID=A0A497EXG7_9CREN|nr:MAG: DNA-binding protein [Candidatus Verstraetearchaeota archaeon]